MDPVGIIFGLIFTVVMAGACIMGGFEAIKEPGHLKWFKIFGFILMAIGIAGYFGTMIAGEGGVRVLASNFEWPVGSAEGVLVMPNKELVVPLRAIGRIQIYDANAKFLRGWAVNFGHGDFKFKSAGANIFEVFTTTDHAHYVYDLDGHLRSQGLYQSQDWDDLPAQSETMPVPTPCWLWPFEGPYHSWIFLIIGMLIQQLGRKKTGVEKVEPRGI